MKITKVILMAILSLISLTSCQKAFDVNSVHFSNEGGTKTITSSSYTLSIHDYNGNYGTGSGENGIIHVEKDWLTAKLDTKAGVITLTADKNDTGKKKNTLHFWDVRRHSKFDSSNTGKVIISPANSHLSNQTRQVSLVIVMTVR